MHVTLFGGSFNPPHLGHALVVSEFLESGLTDEIWLLPTGNHAFGKDLIESHHRLAMSKLLVGYIEKNLRSTIYDLRSKIKVCSIEIDLNLSGKTIDTLLALKENTDYLDEKMLTDHSSLFSAHYSFLIGSDQLTHFKNWSNWENLLTKMPFWVYERAGYPIENLLPGMKLFDTQDKTITNISSTQVRNKIKNSHASSLLLPDSIISYIKEHHLYK